MFNVGINLIENHVFYTQSDPEYENEARKKLMKFNFDGINVNEKNVRVYRFCPTFILLLKT